MKANRKVLYAEMNLVCEREEKDHLRHGVGGLFLLMMTRNRGGM